jgi:hypothetical protein
MKDKKIDSKQTLANKNKSSNNREINKNKQL